MTENMNANTRFEIKAEAFHRMTGMLAPGKDGSCDTVGESFEERIRAWNEWHIENDRIIIAMLNAMEAILE